jgi:hypothetical protein
MPIHHPTPQSTKQLCETVITKFQRNTSGSKGIKSELKVKSNNPVVPGPGASSCKEEYSEWL